MTVEQIQEIVDEDYSAEYFIWQMEEDNTHIEDFFDRVVVADLEDKTIALATHTGESYSTSEDQLLSEDYLVLDDDEADNLAKVRAQDRLDDDLHNVPEHLHQYFNNDDYINDLVMEREFLLAYADGVEHEEVVDGTTYYIYKQ